MKRRNGEAATENVLPKTASDAVKKPDAGGQSTNALEVRVMADKIEFVVNGTVVNSMPRSAQTPKTDGIYRIRVNHLLDVQGGRPGGGEEGALPLATIFARRRERRTSTLIDLPSG